MPYVHADAAATAATATTPNPNMSRICPGYVPRACCSNAATATAPQANSTSAQLAIAYSGITSIFSSINSFFGSSLAVLDGQIDAEQRFVE